MSNVFISEDKQHRVRIEPSEHYHDDYMADSLGTLATWHRRYQIGHEQPKVGLDEYRQSIGDVIELPVYAYEHGNICLRTTPFSCRWDSGLLGIIYVSKQDVRDYYGWKKITPKRLEQVYQRLVDEVKEWSDIVSGNVWDFTCERWDSKEGWVIEDSCGGFVGDWDHAGLEQHMPQPYRHIMESRL